MRKTFKIVVSLVLCLVLFSGCEKKKSHLKPPSSADFESLMGKELPEWKYVRTKEDFANLSFFKTLYEKNIGYLKSPSNENRIPKILHYIWIGPKPFPRTSGEYVRSWIAHHPDWKVYFWTDRERAVPHPSMEVKYIRDLKWRRLQECFAKSENYAEKSDLLRIEILYQLGGVYVDHDIECVKPFDNIVNAYDLFCGMEKPYPTSLESSLFPTNNLLGTLPGHPVLKDWMDWVESVWDQMERDYPGKDRESLINRVAHRTFYALGKVLKERGSNPDTRDIALPTMYFNAPKIEWALYAQHKYDGTWFQNESSFEKSARQRLMYISKKVNKIILFGSVIGALNLIGCVVLISLMMKKRRVA